MRCIPFPLLPNATTNSIWAPHHDILRALVLAVFFCIMWSTSKKSRKDAISSLWLVLLYIQPYALSLSLSLSLCHGFLLAVMYNHRGLEQYQACEDLSLLFNDKTSLEMRTWCIHKETLNDMTKWGSFLIPLAVSDRVILSSKTTNEREKNKLD